MPMRDLPFAFGSNPGRHPAAGVARLVNCYATMVGDGQRARLPIHASPGLRSWATHRGGGETRCMITVDAQLYVVNKRVLSVFDANGAETVLAGIPSDGVVTAARNRRSPYPEVMFVCDGTAYLSTNNTVTKVTDADLPPPVGVCFLNGYFVLPIADGRFFWTAIDRGSVIDALDFASAEGNPDGLIAAKTRGEDLVLFGSRSTEFHRVTGDPDLVFARASIASYGCLSAKSIAEVTVISESSISDTLAWVASDRQGRYAGVIMLDGYSARKVSTDWLDRKITAEADKANITGTSWVSEGHGFYALSGTDWTWVYDTSTGLPHERESFGASRWDIVQVADFSGRLIAASRTNGVLYEMSEDIMTEGSNPLIMTMQSSPIADEVEISELYLDVATGVGTAADPSPTIAMQWSENGNDWSSALARPLGGEAQSQTQVRWHRLGTNRNRRGGRSFRFRSSAGVLRGVYGAKVLAEPVTA